MAPFEAVGSRSVNIDAVTELDKRLGDKRGNGGWLDTDLVQVEIVFCRETWLCKTQQKLQQL